MGILPQISEESKLIIFFPSNIFRANLTNWHWKYIYMAYEFKEALDSIKNLQKLELLHKKSPHWKKKIEDKLSIDQL